MELHIFGYHDLFVTSIISSIFVFVFCLFCLFFSKIHSVLSVFILIAHHHCNMGLLHFKCKIMPLRVMPFLTDSNFSFWFLCFISNYFMLDFIFTSLLLLV